MWVKLCILFCLLILAKNTRAQSEIVISDHLAGNATKLKVKMGVQRMGKIWNFRFGDYAVASSKMGWTRTRAGSNFFDTQTETNSTGKFSFVLVNKTNDSAEVNAVNNIDIQSLRGVRILGNLFIDSEEQLRESKNFSAFITNNRDTSEIWALFMNETISNTWSRYEAFLTNGEREILFTSATSHKKDAANALPALGYELVEDGESIAAVQYLGAGVLGQNKNIIWLRKDLNEKMKIILAAAITAVLQDKN